jgi:hypothetical protein
LNTTDTISIRNISCTQHSIAQHDSSTGQATSGQVKASSVVWTGQAAGSQGCSAQHRTESMTCSRCIHKKNPRCCCLLPPSRAAGSGG